MASPDFKNRLIAKIHVAKKQLAMNDDDYRAVLERVTGKTSSRDLPIAKLNDVLNEMKSLGFKTTTATKRIGTRKLADDPQAKKIRAMWITLRDMGELKDPSEAALLSFVKRMTKVSAFEWLDSKQADTVIDALRGWITRKGGDPNAY